jgi:hypothetical protein
MIKPRHVRYIKLGKGGCWEKVALEKGELHLGHSHISHDVAVSASKASIKAEAYRSRGQPGSAADDAREITDFYTLGSDCLWITFSAGRLWWAFAEPEVTWIGPDSEAHGARFRTTIGPWNCKDTKGNPLKSSRLSSKLTKTASYRRSICKLHNDVESYLIRRINGLVEPIVAEAEQAIDKLIQVTRRGIEALHWSDFETLADLIFARSGWNRVSPLGGNQKDIDLLLEHPSTGEVASVQVKAAANQGVFDEALNEFKANATTDRFFFVCHSPANIKCVDNPRVKLWVGEELARIAARLGLHEWVFEKIR